MLLSRRGRIVTLYTGKVCIKVYSLEIFVRKCDNYLTLINHTMSAITKQFTHFFKIIFPHFHAGKRAKEDNGGKEAKERRTEET